MDISNLLMKSANNPAKSDEINTLGNSGEEGLSGMFPPQEFAQALDEAGDAHTLDEKQIDTDEVALNHSVLNEQQLQELPPERLTIATSGLQVAEDATILPVPISPVSGLVNTKIHEIASNSDEEALNLDPALLVQDKSTTKMSKEDLLLAKQLQEKVTMDESLSKLQASKQVAQQLEMETNPAFQQLRATLSQTVDSSLIVKDLKKGQEGSLDIKSLQATYGQESIKMDSVHTRPVTATKITAPVSDHSWREAFSEKILWMSHQNIKAASVQLNPPELGPMEILLKMNQQQASLVVNTQHQSVKTALEDAMPNLKDLLDQQGIELVDANITDGHSQADQSEEGDETIGHLSKGADEAGVTNKAVAHVPKGLVDHYV